MGSPLKPCKYLLQNTFLRTSTTLLMKIFEEATQVTEYNIYAWKICVTFFVGNKPESQSGGSLFILLWWFHNKVRGFQISAIDTHRVISAIIPTQKTQHTLLTGKQKLTYLSSHLICTQPGLRMNDHGWYHFSTTSTHEHSVSNQRCRTCSLSRSFYVVE